MTHKSSFFFRLLILFAMNGMLFFSRCTVTRCETDTEKPLISIRLTGPGRFREYRSDDAATHGRFIDQVQLNMDPNITYSFIALISDSCGAHNLRVTFDDVFILTDLKDGNGALLTASSLGGSKIVEVTGRVEDGHVKTALIITGKFTTPARSIAGVMSAFGYDYGGTRIGSPNSGVVYLGLAIQSGKAPGEIPFF